MRIGNEWCTQVTRPGKEIESRFKKTTNSISVFSFLFSRTRWFWGKYQKTPDWRLHFSFSNIFLHMLGIDKAFFFHLCYSILRVWNVLTCGVQLQNNKQTRESLWTTMASWYSDDERKFDGPGQAAHISRPSRPSHSSKVALSRAPLSTRCRLDEKVALAG